MAESKGDVDWQEQLNRLSRREARGIEDERALVAATGAAPSAWPIEVVSLAGYNVYNVRQVSIGGPGTQPSPVSSSTMEAVNVAEPFLAAGSVAAGTYAVMWRAGDKNVFYVEP